MAAEWGEVTTDERDNYIEQNGGDVDTIQAAIAFSFFAILIWVSIGMYILCSMSHINAGVFLENNLAPDIFTFSKTTGTRRS